MNPTPIPAPIEPSPAPMPSAIAFPAAFVFFVFEVGLVATLQAFIFATLTSIYIGGAVAESH
jgi:F0F1-type ATP synthase membrane subunit a